MDQVVGGKKIGSQQTASVARRRAEPGRMNDVSREGAAEAARLAVTLERSSDGAASAVARPAGVRRGGSASGGRDRTSDLTVECLRV